jgi:ketosteroid isomerase-like protein
MKMGKRLFILTGVMLSVALGLAIVDSGTKSMAEGGDPSGPLATLDAFHGALASKDSAGAVALLADDVLIQEGGHVETRDEYLNHHLGADMEFASQVPTRREVLRAIREGDVAWVASSTHMEGEFKGQPVLAGGAELVVLSRLNGAWRIRSVHWSSYNKKASD